MAGGKADLVAVGGIARRGEAGRHHRQERPNRRSRVQEGHQ